MVAEHREDIAFRKEFEEFAQKNRNLKLVFTVNQPAPRLERRNRHNQR